MKGRVIELRQVVRYANGRTYRERWVPAADGQRRQAILLSYQSPDPNEVTGSVGLCLSSREEVLG